MTTPAYVPQAPANLTASTTGPNVPVNAQTNDNALADECALMGMLAWNATITWTSGKVTKVVMARGVYRVRVDYTYVPSGPAIGKIQDATHYWSNDSGVSYTLRTDTGVTAGKQTFNYDGSGVLTGSTWS